MRYLFILPIVNDLYTLGMGIIYKFGQLITNNNILGASLGFKLIIFADSNLTGNLWLVLFVPTLIIGIGSFIYAYCSRDRYSIDLGVACIVSIIISLFVVYYFFS